MRAKLGTLRRSRREEVLQQFFSRLVVDTSAQMGLLEIPMPCPSQEMVPYYSGASSYGIKVCECKSQGIFNCQCPGVILIQMLPGDGTATGNYIFGDSLYAFTAAEPSMIFLSIYEWFKQSAMTASLQYSLFRSFGNSFLHYE